MVSLKPKMMVVQDGGDGAGYSRRREDGHKNRGREELYRRRKKKKIQKERDQVFLKTPPTNLLHSTLKISPYTNVYIYNLAQI